MKKRKSTRQLKALEQEMLDATKWEDTDHTLSFKGPTSIRFSSEVLRKLHVIATVRNKPINRLVNEYVKSFVDHEYEIVEELK